MNRVHSLAVGTLKFLNLNKLYSFRVLEVTEDAFLLRIFVKDSQEPKYIEFIVKLPSEKLNHFQIEYTCDGFSDDLAGTILEYMGYVSDSC